MLSNRAPRMLSWTFQLWKEYFSDVQKYLSISSSIRQYLCISTHSFISLHDFCLPEGSQNNVWKVFAAVLAGLSSSVNHWHVDNIPSASSFSLYTIIYMLQLHVSLCRLQHCVGTRTVLDFKTCRRLLCSQFGWNVPCSNGENVYILISFDSCA